MVSKWRASLKKLFSDVILKKFTEEKQSLLMEVQKLHEELNSYKTEGRVARGISLNGSWCSDDDYEMQSKLKSCILKLIDFLTHFISRRSQ